MLYMLWDRLYDIYKVVLILYGELRAFKSSLA